jgi:GT2 family glycosyltransferase
MTYLLKTHNTCNNDCIYCDYLNRKIKKKKSLAEIKKEIKNILKKGYTEVRLACNTDNRKDFLEILKLLKDNNLNVVLETNARILSFKGAIQKIDDYIERYEVLFSSPSKDMAKFINKVDNGYFEQSIIGLKNIINSIQDKNRLTIKTVILNENLNCLQYIIDMISDFDARRIKFIYPFKLKKEDSVPSINWTSKTLTKIKKYAEQKGLEVIIGDEIEVNPYIKKDSDFLNTENAKIKYKKIVYKEKPHISIIIPTRDRLNPLKYVLKSFFLQEFDKKDYEVIVIGDGSESSTEKMIRNLKPTCNLTYIHWPRKKEKFEFDLYKYAKYHNRAGLSRNIGINHAEGNIIIFNDDDTVVDKFCLKDHNKYHKEEKDLIVRGFRMYLPENFRPSEKNIQNIEDLKKISIPEEPLSTRTLNCRLYNLHNEGWKRVISTNLSIRKENLLKTGLFSNDSPFWGYEDVEFGYRAKLAGLRLMWDDNIKIFHIHHKKQTGNTYQTMATFWINTNIFYRKYFDEDIFKLYRSVIINRLDNSILKD